MLELNISQNQNSFSSAFGKWFARVEYKKTMSIDDMARHMAEHNTPFTVGTIAGILKDFVSCTREMCLEGNTVKIDNLVIFKCSVQGNGLDIKEGYKIVGGWAACLPRRTPTARLARPTTRKRRSMPSRAASCWRRPLATSPVRS